MLVFVHSYQLRHIVEKAIYDSLRMEPMNLQIESKHLSSSSKSWEVLAGFQENGRDHQLKVVIDPSSGHVRKVEVHRRTIYPGG